MIVFEFFGTRKRRFWWCDGFCETKSYSASQRASPASPHTTTALEDSPSLMICKDTQCPSSRQRCGVFQFFHKFLSLSPKPRGVSWAQEILRTYPHLTHCVCVLAPTRAHAPLFPHIPPDSGFYLQFESYSRKLNNEFPIILKENSPDRIIGIVGNSTNTVKMESSSGSLRITS